MRPWIPLLAVLLGVCMVFGLAAATATAHDQMNGKILLYSDVRQSLGGAVISPAVPYVVVQPRYLYSYYFTRPVIVQPYIRIKSPQWIISQRGFWPFRRVWIYHRLE